MSPVEAPNEPAKAPAPPDDATTQQPRIDFLFRHVTQDPGAQRLKTLIESLQTGDAP